SSMMFGVRRVARFASGSAEWQVRRLATAGDPRGVTERPLHVCAGFLAPPPAAPPLSPVPTMPTESLDSFWILCLTSLLAIINPLTTAPMYLSMTDGYSPEHRQHTLRTAIATGIVVLVLFALLGGTIFRLFGITIHAFR